MYTLSTNSEQLEIFAAIDSSIMDRVEEVPVRGFVLHHLVLSADELKSLAEGIRDSDFDFINEIGLPFNEGMSDLLFEIRESGDSDCVYGIWL